MDVRVPLYMLTSNLSCLFPPQFSHWLQVRKVGTVYLFIYFYIRKFKKKFGVAPKEDPERPLDPRHTHI